MWSMVCEEVAKTDVTVHEFFYWVYVYASTFYSFATFSREDEIKKTTHTQQTHTNI